MANWTTRLIHAGAHAPAGFASLVTPVFRGSTTVFPSAADAIDHWNHDEAPYSYGLYGTPTALELAARIAELESGYRTFLTPGGQSAIALIDFALLSAGDHALIPESIYGPNRDFATARHSSGNTYSRKKSSPFFFPNLTRPNASQAVAIKRAAA